MKLVKQVVRVGNTGGVLVPREWLDGMAEVRLVEKPIDVESDVLQILKPFLSDVKGIYVVGSYARGEQTAHSDVDVLVLTGSTTRILDKGKHHFILISEHEFAEQLSTNALPLLPMIREARPLMNGSLLKQYKQRRLTRKNLSWHLQTTSSALAVLNEALSLDEETREAVSDDEVYCLVLRLRGVYIVDCLLQEKTPTTKGLLSLTERLSRSTEAYESYIRIKQGGKARRVVSVKAARAIVKHIAMTLAEQRTWAETNG